MTYLLYDTALNGPYTFMLLRQPYPVCQSLFKGTKDESLSDVAPYLFEVDELLYEKITGPLVSLKAVVLIQSGDSIDKLCTHFKNFIYQKIDGREHYFRCWDARVLNKVLPGWPNEKAEEFFEDIISFSFLNDEAEDVATRFTMLHGKLQKQLIRRDELFGNKIVATVQTSPAAQNIQQPETNGQAKKPPRKFFYD